MGATTSTAANSARLPSGVNNLIGELGSDVQYERGMGSSRFLKAIKARHKHGPLVVKTFLKPEAFFSLRPLVRRLRIEREALADVPNILTYQKVVETETAGYLIRQWMATNLYDRISTRPFLTIIEKKWITFQLLSAMKEARRRNVPHGDLKCENVLITSSLSVYVTDFASSFKQVYLPLNDPSDFNFFFGTSGRRTCYIAPERFYAEDSDIARQKAKARADADAAAAAATRSTPAADRNVEALAELFKRDGKINEAMDVFSLGCVIAELWRDGAPIFTLMQLFKYREGQLDIEPSLAEIPDQHVRNMVRSMLALDPKKRRSFSDYLEGARQHCFPETFYNFLHRYLTTLQRTSARAAALAEAEASVAASKGIMSAANTAHQHASHVVSAETSEVGTAAAGQNELAYLLRAEADERIERMFEEWSIIAQVLDGKTTAWEESAGLTSDDVEYNSEVDHLQQPFRTSPDAEDDLEAVLPVRLSIPGISRHALLQKSSPVDEDGPALLVLSPLLANLRNALRPSTKLHCFEMLLHLSSRWLSDEAKLDRVLPYLVTLFDDESISVRTAAVRTVVQLLALVKTLTPSNVSTFSEYITPNLRLLTKDPSSLVRAMFASCLVELTHIATRFLQMASALRAEGVFTADMESHMDNAANDFFESEHRVEDDSNFDRHMEATRAFFEEQAILLLTDPTPVVKRSLLANIGTLCTFFGSALTNDVILSHMITYLNDRSWMLRKAFFDAIIDVAQVAGIRSVEDYILTLLLQALSDPEEFVVLHVMHGLRRMLASQESGVRLLTQAKIFDVIAAVAGFLCHPNHWLRTASALVIATGASQLGATDTWAILYPSIRPLLRSDVQEIKPQNLLFAVKEPLSREVLQKAVQWAFRAKNSRFWKPQNEEARGKTGLGNGLGKEGVGLMLGRREKSLTRIPIQRNEEDDAHFDSLRSSGMSENDEFKLIALREYITKLAKMSNLIGSGYKANAPSSFVNQEDAALLPPLQIKSSLAVQSLDDVTPLTIFFSSKNASSTALSKAIGGLDAVSNPASTRSQTANSTFSGRIARKRLAGGRTVSDMSTMNPLEELRRRMNDGPSEVLALPATPDGTSDAGQDDRIPGYLNLPSSPIGVAATGVASQGKLGVGKAHAAIASNPTTATGTMAEGSAKLGARRQQFDSERTSPVGSAADHRENGRNAGELAANESSFTSTYDGNDPYIRAHLEVVYLSNFQDRDPAWGPTINGAMRRRVAIGARTGPSGARTTGVGTPNTSASSNRRPEGNLVAYFTEHAAAITAIAVSPDHTFFVSGSEDGTVKVWDTARLEKNVTSRSRGTYSAQSGKITSLIMLEGSHCAASAATDGSVHVIRVEVATSASTTSSLPRYGKIRLVSNFQLSNPDEHVIRIIQGSKKSGVTTRDAALSTSSGAPVTSANTSGLSAVGSTLILATSKNRIVILDLRTMQVLTNFQNPAYLGSVSAIFADPKNTWLLVATIGGVMCLWDLRFGLLVKTWRLSTLRHRKDFSSGLAEGGEEHQANIGSQDAIRINSIALHPSRGKGRWVMIAFELLNLAFQSDAGLRQGDTEKLIETWDVESGTCVEIFDTSRKRKHTSVAIPRDGDVEPENGDADVFEDTPRPVSQKRDERFAGLGSAANAIERLVREHEAELDRQQRQAEHQQTKAQQHDASPRDGQSRKAAPDDEDEDEAKLRRVKGRDVLPPPASSSAVRAFLVSTEGYTSSAVPHAAQVSGGWLDAGKLVAGDHSDNTTTTGPAGFLLTGGLDRKIRFWDLGRLDKSTSFGSLGDEKDEFLTSVTNIDVSRNNDIRGAALENGGGNSSSEQDGNNQAGSPRLTRRTSLIAAQNDTNNLEQARGSRRSRAVRFTHIVYPTAATSKAAAHTLRSPLLTHYSSSSSSTSLMKIHKDAITALAIIEAPFRCVVAGDYAGNIRVWE